MAALASNTWCSALRPNAWFATPIVRSLWSASRSANSSNPRKPMNTLAKKSRRVASVRPNAAIRLDESIRRDDSLDLKRIVVPVDFSGPSLNSLRYAARLAAQSGASIFPLYVAEHVIYLDKPATFPRLNVLEEMKQKLA